MTRNGLDVLIDDEGVRHRLAKLAPADESYGVG